MLKFNQYLNKQNTIINIDGIDYAVADKFPINFSTVRTNKGDKLPMFYACGFYEALDAFNNKCGPGCYPHAVLFRTKKEADEYVANKAITVRGFVAEDLETIDILISKMGLK